ncbi:MAG: TetR/AcrR family transcriptional regulator [Bacteroidota bacterium]
MSDTAERIFQKADELFMRYGIRSITMDEIAQRLGISKKTLYQYVENKADLIEKVVQQHLAAECKARQHIQTEAEDAIHEMILEARHAAGQLREMSPTIVHDLKKYYPKCWKLIEQMHNGDMRAIIAANLQKGIEQGLYRADIQPEMVAVLQTNQMIMLMDEDIFPLKTHNRSTLLGQFLSYHIHGIASPKGIALYKKHIEKEFAF